MSVVSVAHGATAIELVISSELYDIVQELATTFDVDSKQEFTAIELHALFLRHCKVHNENAALAVLGAFCKDFDVPAANIHVVVQQQDLSEEAARLVLNAYYLLWNISAARCYYFSDNSQTLPALFSADSAHLMAVFGGQPGLPSYLDEARWLFNAYGPLLSDFVMHMSEFLDAQARDGQLSGVYEKGLCVFKWLNQPGSEPDVDYLTAVPVSIPLTGLIQLMQLMVLYKTLGVSPGNLTQLFKVATGHSQGVVIATALSMFSDEQSFYEISTNALGILMLVGAIPCIKYPHFTLIDANDISAKPRPMVSVRGVSQATLETLLVDFNALQTEDETHVYVSIINTHNQFIVSGLIESLIDLVEFLDSRSVSPDTDQSKVPFNLRQPVISAEYFDMIAPYHCFHLDDAVDMACDIAREKQWVLDSGAMQLPVRTCDDGHDIRNEADLLWYLFQSICVLPVNWPQTLAAPEVSHIVDFGPSSFSAHGQLMSRNVEGRGISVISASALTAHSVRSGVDTKSDLYKSKLSEITVAPDWQMVCGPRLVRIGNNGPIHIDTRMHRVLGMPTVMVAGMTPTTASEQFVAAIMNAGYHAEIAGGGMNTESDMVTRLHNLAESILPGQGITLNCIYINPSQWSFQFTTLLRLRRDGLPIAGLCIGGGVPSFDKALEIISELRAVGIRHMSFKPSNAEAIRHVIKIAQASDGFPVVLQWTGGRGGGHHSFEDFHQPILETYAAIRKCDNIVLVAGSGFGDAEGTLPYMTGDWSVEFGRAPMPFDGILLGSRVMVAKEAGTSLAAKELIVAAAGTPDSEWHKTHNGEHGGVTSLLTEYGESNHALKTRAVLFIQDMQLNILSQPRNMQLQLLLARKNEIILRLNSDYMRPWFGRTADGRVVDLEEMTYAEVICRLVELMYVTHEQRWVHESHLKLVVDFISRCECRMSATAAEIPISILLDTVEPTDYADMVVNLYPDSKTQLLTSEDVQFFVQLCKRRGQKPLPFIPALDLDFGVLLLKDTTWQSEDLAFVVDQDPQRVGIQQGPVAAQYSTRTDEPVKDIIDGIYKSHVAALLERQHHGDESSVPVVEYIGAEPAINLPNQVSAVKTEAEHVYHLPTDAELLPNHYNWLETLAGPSKSWLRALLTTPVIAQDSRLADNQFQRLLRPRPGQTTAVHFDNGRPVALQIVGSSGKMELELRRIDESRIVLTVHHEMMSGSVVLLKLEYSYCPGCILAPIHGSKVYNDEEIRRFYIESVVNNSGAPETKPDVPGSDLSLAASELVITEDHVRSLCRNVKNLSRHYARNIGGHLRAPPELMAFSVSCAMLWFLNSLRFGHGQFDVVHLSARVELKDGMQMLSVGEVLTGTASITSLYNLPAGKVMTVTNVIRRQGVPVGTIVSSSIARGHFISQSAAFQRVSGQRIAVMLYSEEDIAILEFKEWFYYHEDTAARLQPNVIIEFCLDSEYRYLTDTAFSSIVTKGSVAIKSRTGKRIDVGTVDFQWSAAKGNPVIEYLERHKVAMSATLFGDGGYELTALSPEYATKVTVPSSNHEYARLSFDRNPIHTNPYIADMAGLPGMITHGMWTSASTRAVVEQVAAKDCPERIRMYQTEFTGMVLPNDRLTTKLYHVGMREGRMLVKGNTSNASEENVMNVLAEVDQPLTAYVFTGQGSQKVGMGMELYQQSPAARAVWDRADNHMLATYGLSIMDIVRTNPGEKIVYFYGNSGEAIRSNYMAYGETSLVPGLTAESSSFTFQAAGGLLNATQFTQVALVTAALAAVADMQMRGLVQTHAVFAGHSLGELCALAALTDMFTLNNMMDIVFYRGLIMQSAVQRGEHNTIDYGMVAVDPSRVPAFDERQLHLVVDAIGGEGLIQVVNYNVRNNQYVVAGSLANLAVLRLVLDDMAINGCSDKLSIEQMVKQVQVTSETPVRGMATIPLTGINVPFHSRLLLEGVALFRDVLQAKVGMVEPDTLEQRYIPNLTGMPFEVSQEYFKLVYDATKSSVIKEALNNWDDALLDVPAERSRLATILLIELLSYQLASPVQWIKTQDYLFNIAGVQRMVEIGPSPVLCGMAAKTLEAVLKSKRAELLHIERDHDAIYYVQPESKILDNSNAAVTVAATPGTEPQPEASAKPESKPANSEPSQPPPQPQVGSEANAPIADQPIPVLDVILAIIAFKAKKPLGDISIQQSIKSLVAGKSTFQNELLGDLQKEFGNKIPDKAEEMSLKELASAVGSSGGSLGKCTQPFVARMFNSKMPGGFSLAQTRSTLQTSYGLGPLRQDALFLVALTMEPVSRLTSEAEASAWLSTVAQTYAARVGISYVVSLDSTGGAGRKGAVPAISSAEMQKIRQQEVAHIQQQIQVLARYAGIDLLDGTRSAGREKAVSAELQSELDQAKIELGDEFMTGVLPQFDARKARHFDSYWNWARQDAYEWIQQAIAMCSLDTIRDKHLDLCNATRVQRLKNCANAELLELLSGTAKVLRTSNNSMLEPVVQLVDTLHKACQQALENTPVYCELSAPMQPKTRISAKGDVSYTEIARKNEPTYAAFIERIQLAMLSDQVPPIHMSKQTSSGQWIYNREFTSVYFDGLSNIARQGVSYVGKTALVTGCGRGSIGAEIVRGLLMGGAKVLATTSSYSRKTTLFFEDMYRECGSRGSELIVVPFNQGSVQDINSLVSYIFGTGAGDLSWNLDYVFPFAAISDIGSMATNLGSHSELAQRIMLTNVMRLLGAIKSAQASLKCSVKPVLVVLPLSPNHGNFGGDGLYGECKIGLETAFNRWASEGWEGYLSIIGAVIGWVRGTGLMSSNNIVAQAIEDSGARTFTTHESAFTILGLLCSQISYVVHKQPVWVNLDGGLGCMKNLGAIGLAERDRIERRSKILSGINLENSSDIAILFGNKMSDTVDAQDRSPLAKPTRYFPTAKSYDYLENLRHMQGMVNLDKVVVITGYGEVSPYGNAETRWEIEAFGELTMEGCIELAWIMGLIKHHNGPLALIDQHYTGWVDAKSGESVRDVDIKPRYHEYILAHTGIRPIEPELSNGYNPDKKAVIQEMLIEHDMEPFEASVDEAAAFKQSNGDRVDIWENTNGTWLVRFLKGAVIHVPMSVSAASFAAGLIPTGWSAARFGIPEDIVNQVDPITLFTLVATVEALVRSGFTDPYELYKYFHVSEVGNSIGSGVGGLRALHDIFNKRAHNQNIRNDAMQEGLISTIQAWVNMLLLSASGPVKPLVGACASTAISIDSAVEAIQAGKAKVMLAGSTDDFSEESSTEFVCIGASSNAQEAIACGRTISEMSRPCTSTRSGFMEGQGSGVVVLMSASAAIACGAPIYGIVGMSGSATDKVGRSVPAPGKGILTSARQTGCNTNQPLLDLNYRRRGLERQLRALDGWKVDEIDEIQRLCSETGDDCKGDTNLQLASVEKVYQRNKRNLLDTWGNEFWRQDTDISPLRGSLAVWGLTADDIGLASFHGTSTQANDKNESEVINVQLKHVGRTPGHVVPAVCQKWLTGHAKGAAASFMVNGVLQSLRTGLIPGNRNADNISAELKECDYSLYLSRTIQTTGIKAALLNSFGFGQVSGELLIIHPDYLLATLEKDQLEKYNKKLLQRDAKSQRYWQDVLVGNHTFVQAKSHPPYTEQQEQSVYLNPLARAHFDPATKEYKF